MSAADAKPLPFVYQFAAGKSQLSPFSSDATAIHGIWDTSMKEAAQHPIARNISAEPTVNVYGASAMCALTDHV
jgi:hypothetical protein